MRTILFLALLFVSIECFSQQDVAQWRGPNRNGVYPEKNLLPKWPDGGPKLLWRYDAIGKGYSSAAVTSDRVFTAGLVDGSLSVFSFDLKGKLLWKNTLGPEWNDEKKFPGTRSTPLIYDGLGYIASGLGMLYCFDTKTGKVNWTKNLFKDFDGSNVDWGFTENMVVDGNKLFCTPGGSNDNVVALDRTTGKVIWKSKGSGEPCAYSSPIIIERNGKRFFVTMSKRSIFSINIENGSLVWKQSLVGDSHANTPIFNDGLLCAYDGIGGVVWRISDDGLSISEAWKNNLIRLPQGDGVVFGGNLFTFNSNKNQIYCFDWNSGVIKYSYPIKASIVTIISAEGLLYCCNFNQGDVYLLKPNGSSFELMGKFTLPGNQTEHCAHPVIKDGRIYFRINNMLFAYSIAV